MLLTLNEPLTLLLTLSCYLMPLIFAMLQPVPHQPQPLELAALCDCTVAEPTIERDVRPDAWI